MNHIKAHNIGFLTEKWNVRKQNTRQLSEDITEAWNKEGLGVDPSIDFYGPKATFMYDKNETVSDQAIIAGARWFMNETAENNGSKDIGDEDITKNWQEHQIIDWIENNFENGLDGLISDGNDYVPKPKVVREKWNVKPLNEMEGHDNENLMLVLEHVFLGERSDIQIEDSGPKPKQRLGLPLIFAGIESINF